MRTPILTYFMTFQKKVKKNFHFSIDRIPRRAEACAKFGDTKTLTTAADTSVATIAPVHIHNAQAPSDIVIVCEHASCEFPPEFNELGISQDAAHSHIAWDPGALPIAKSLGDQLNAPLVAGGLSRLLYDCNRPPEAPDAIPVTSEDIPIPGNQNLPSDARAQRVQHIYGPFRKALAETVGTRPNAILITIHSFTPIYRGVSRPVEIGVLHDSDSRLADAMLDTAADHTNLRVERNQPYGPQDGVTHTLCEHALGQGHLNVMLEIRNDLITTQQEQTAMADMLTAWIGTSLTRLGRAISKDGTCAV